MRQWELIAKLEKNGHRLFREVATGKYAIADNSGPTPSTTEDGAMYLREGKHALTFRPGADGDTTGAAALPLVDSGGEQAWTGVGLDAASKLVELLPEKYHLEAESRSGQRFAIVPIPEPVEVG